MMLSNCHPGPVELAQSPAAWLSLHDPGGAVLKREMISALGRCESDLQVGGKIETMQSNWTNTSLQYEVRSTNDQSSTSITLNNAIPVLFVGLLFVYCALRRGYDVLFRKTPPPPSTVVVSMVSDPHCNSVI
jgi:hypothetical protein